MYGLLGRTLGHSLSPQIHNCLGDYKYELFCKEPEELDAFFADQSIKAFNVTIPYKVNAFNYCDELSPTAQKIGSVNTVIRRKDGSLYGDNTDYFGFECMAKKYGADFAEKKVVVLGSGGASLTVCHVAHDKGAKEVVVISRSGENNYDNISRNYDADIVINTTPVGMFPNNYNKPVDLSEFKKCKCVLDLIYNPCNTALLMQAKELGIPCGNGLLMLVAQALRSSEQFVDRKLGDDMIFSVYEKILAQQKNIVLIGMPGCGKSTLAKNLADRLKRQFIDTDERIVEAAGKTIPQIFEDTGETGFRDLETEIIKDVGKQLGKVIATGGGAVLKKENRDALIQNGTVIYLKKDLNLLVTDGRPLSKSTQALSEILKKRKPIYEAMADFEIDVDADVNLTAERVIKCIF